MNDLSFLEFAPPGKCFILHSGAHTPVRIVVEKLGLDWLPPLPADFAVGETAFLGVPTGGAWIAKRLKESYWTGRLQKGKPTHIIDDVWTTGTSVREFIAAQGLDPKACLVWVMFLRGDPPPEGEFAGFTYHVDARHLPLWTAKECPLCFTSKFSAGDVAWVNKEEGKCEVASLKGR